MLKRALPLFFYKHNLGVYKMKFSRIILTALLSLGLAVPAMAAEEIVVNGSTTVLPVIQKTAEAYMAAKPEVSIAISGGGSGNGIKAIIDSLCNIAMTSRDIKSSEIKLAESKGIKPLRHVVAVDALVPVVHPSNTIKNLTVAQLADIYMGKIRNWEEVGGPDARVVVISRDTSSGTYETWQEKILGKKRVSPAALLQASSGAVVQAVAKNKNAIGYIGYGYVDASTKTVEVDGFAANEENALSGKWPIARELYLFTNGEPQGEAKGFIDFVISTKGQALVKEVGFIPLSK